MIDPRWYQVEAKDAVYNYFYQGNTGHPLVVMPGGSGKSLTMAILIYETLFRWPSQRILVASHVKELVKQDFDALCKVWPRPDAGIYSASLGQRRFADAVTFATVQSIARKAHIIGRRDLLIIDEAHLLSENDDSQYRKLIAGMLEINPHMKVIGFTATPFRLGQGYLHQGENALFTDIAYEISVKQLLDEGYLSPLTSYAPTATQANMENVRITAGEFNTTDMVAEFDHLIEPVADDIIAKTQYRSSIIVFCPRVDTCEKMQGALAARGMHSAHVVTGETPAEQRDTILREFKKEKIRCLLSVGIVTTGFDAPCTDCIVLFRATTSPGLYLQMIVRGMRLHPSKTDCLVLDYGGNIRRHGPVTNITPPAARGAKKEDDGEEKVKICEACGAANPVPAGPVCFDCGTPFPVLERRPDATKYRTHSDDEADPLYTQPPAPPKWVDVLDVTYKRHAKPGKPSSLWVKYLTEFEEYSEWVCFEHEGYALDKARHWWMQRARARAMPHTAAEAADVAPTLPQPTRIKVRQEGKYWRVLEYDFTPRPPEIINVTQQEMRYAGEA
jgi:DNA repair protein RadD